MTVNDQQPLSGPDLGSAGLGADELTDGTTLLGHARGEAVLLGRVGREFFAVETTCTHYGGPATEGVLE